jgi:hypothetical protein
MPKLTFRNKDNNFYNTVKGNVEEYFLQKSKENR